VPKSLDQLDKAYIPEKNSLNLPLNYHKIDAKRFGAQEAQ
jgi:hypothetical protein